MADANKGNQEPSMEEILSSIRRIIADEDGGEPSGPAAPVQGRGERPGAAAARAPEPRDLARDDDDEVLELTEVVDPARQEPVSAPPPAPRAAAAPAPPPPPRARSEEPPMRSTAPMTGTDAAGDGLISRNAADASAQALARLTRAAGSGEDRGSSPLAQVTVERLLADLLTPMLKDWLDQNLPQIVERVVEQEVKKLARRAELL